jgi:hypothetical protein
MNTDTPLPPEEPAGENPPDGAIIDYYLPGDANEIYLDIVDANGRTIRHYSNKDTMYKVPPVNIPQYWIRPQQMLPGEKGAHRFTWDMRYTPLNVPASFPIAAVHNNTAPAETSPFAMPGKYTAVLGVNGRRYSQPLTIAMDPRVKTSKIALQKQHDLSVTCYEGRKQCMQVLAEIRQLRAQIKNRVGTDGDAKAKDDMLVLFETGLPNGEGASFNKLNNSFATLLNILQEADVTPTSQATNAVNETQSMLKELLRRFGQFKQGKL